MNNIIYGVIAPHPPLLIPDIGGKRIDEVASTDKAYNTVAKDLTNKNPDITIFITPHGPISQDKIRIYNSDFFYGDFSMFGLPFLKYSALGESAYTKEVFNFCKQKNYKVELIDYAVLDHGIMVPLHYLQKFGYKNPILPLAISLEPLTYLYEFGVCLADAINSLDKKVAVVASADMSHSLTKTAPNGYNPNGPIFDKMLVDFVKKNDVKSILNFDENISEEASQDALWSIAILLGMLKSTDFSPKVLSYEGPFGVGYMVAKFDER